VRKDERRAAPIPKHTVGCEIRGIVVVGRQPTEVLAARSDAWDTQCER
jgi:hypothetical protein